MTPAPGANGSGDGASLDARQRADLATLLAREIATGNLESLAESVVGRKALNRAANDRADRQAYAEAIVSILHDEKRIEAAIFQLRTQARPTSRLIFFLNRILAGERLDDGTSYQHFIDENEPFLSSEQFNQFFPRVMRATCLVGLDTGGDPVWGSGFLVGPDLVMTNYHVVQQFLTKGADGAFTQNGAGEKIHFFFDYHTAPAPKLPIVTASARSDVVHVCAHANWYVYASESLPGDGTDGCPPQADGKLDYAIIRVEQPLGTLPTRRSGGEERGWLSLLDVHEMQLDEQLRLLVLGHPGTEPQLFDFGTLRQLDPTLTRVWYAVSTAAGSSGGPAVDVAGKLVALHNAEVRRQGVDRLNQGVRLDRIVPHLTQANVRLALQPPPSTTASPAWSLTDDLSNPQPIIGRQAFVSYVTEMSKLDGARVLVVSGPEGSGRKFSVDLLRRTIGPQIPVARFGPTALQQLAPEMFVRAIAEQIGIGSLAATPIPAVKAAEDVPRWLRTDLPAWLADRMGEEFDRDKTRFPAWVVIDTTLPGNDTWLWAANLKDCIAALAGVPEPGQRVIDLPYLRWLFLGYSVDGLPVGGLARNEEPLAKDVRYVADCADCMDQAWRSLKPGTQTIPRALAEYFAGQWLAAAGTTPVRKHLAAEVRKMYLSIRQANDA